MDESDLDDSVKVSVIDGSDHRIWSRCTIILNSEPCKSNSYFGLYNSINTYISMRKHSLSSLGRNMYYKDMHIKNWWYNRCYYFCESDGWWTQEIDKHSKNILHMMTLIKYIFSWYLST